MTVTELSHLSSDLTELILSRLPIPSLLRCSAVCKLWLSIITAPTFPPSSARPWLFLSGFHNTSARNHQSFAFEPSSFLWLRLPTPAAAAATVLSPFLRQPYPPIPLSFPRVNPLSAAIPSPGEPAYLVVGGVLAAGNLVDIDAGSRLPSELYLPSAGAWVPCPPLPLEFPSADASSLSSALLGHRFHVSAVSSGLVSSFHLPSRTWSPVRTLRPSSFLVACSNILILAGIRISGGGDAAEFVLWRVDEETMEVGAAAAAMPGEMLSWLFEDAYDFASLKVVGAGDSVYVFNEDYHRTYPAVVCRIDPDAGAVSWRRLPPLPSPVNKFHKVVSFCSVVSLRDVLGRVV